jgi:hypothetical protein
MGSAANALLPFGWSLGSGSSVGATLHTQRSAGTSGEGALTGNSLGGFYNFANGVNATSTDRSVGFLADSFFTPNKSLWLQLRNNTGTTISQLNLSFDIEKYRAGISAYDMNMYIGFFGANSILLADASQHYDGDPQNAVVDPPATINKSAVTDVTVPDQAIFFLRWQYNSSELSNGQGLGIDNFRLTATSFQQELQWDAPPAASWDSASSNWKNAAGAHVIWSDSTPDNARFIDAGPGVTDVVQLTSTRRAGHVTFDAGSRNYTLQGGSLQLTGGGGLGISAFSDAQIQSGVQIITSQTWDIASTLSVSGPLNIPAGATLKKKGAGTLVLSGTQSSGSNSTLDVTEGTLRLAANVGNISGSTLSLTIRSNPNNTDSLVILDADEDFANLNILSDPGKQGLDLSSPAAPGAYRSVRVHFGDPANLKVFLSSLVRRGRDNSGEGIYDSGLAAHAGSAIGVAAMPAGYVQVRPTRIGDLNLDGAVTISDFIDLSSHFGSSAVTWQEGDMNLDGAVTISDFIDLASNFGTTYAGEVIAVSQPDQQTMNDFAAAHGVVVPEPASVMLAVFGSLATLRPRRLQFAK